MFFHPVKEINRSRKGINRFLRGISNIYLKVTIEEKNWRFQNFDFLSLKNMLPSQFWGAPTHEDIIAFRGLKAKLCVAFLLFHAIYEVLKP